MAIAVLIMGKSGSGKSSSMRNFKDEKIALINVLNKPLPFKGKFTSTMATDDYGRIKNALRSASKKSVVIDDASYLITNQFMRGHSSAGKGNGVFSLYNDLGDQFWQLIEFIKTLPPEKIVYVVMHEEQSELGMIKPKTIGKMLDEKVCVEGQFAIVLRSVFIDGNYCFRTKTDGSDVTKTPMGLFDDELISNDLEYVDREIRDYYGIAV
ncbi:MAG: AAA family ATPase [Treponema sp.]|jgi:hypothetical protein|nr:AAA family ATPase [Treponema sp.]